MKLIITRGHTKERNKEWNKVEFTIESDEIDDSQLENERLRLESLIDSWLNNDNDYKPTNQKGFCVDCGKNVSKNRFGQYYKRCFECNKKHKGEG